MGLRTSALVVLVGVLAAVLFDLRPGDPTTADIQVIASNPRVEKLLEPFRDLIGTDYPGYRGHVYRVLTYTMHFLEYDTKFTHVIEAALVYHDIGLWTAAVMNYIDPSVARAAEDFKDVFNAEELQMLKDAIQYHHKVTDFEGPNAREVNAVRKGDWIDASYGVVRQGMSRANVAKTMTTLPNDGFHRTLLEFGPRLHGYNIPTAVWEFLKIFYW